MNYKNAYVLMNTFNDAYFHRANKYKHHFVNKNKKKGNKKQQQMKKKEEKKITIKTLKIAYTTR